MVKMDAHPHKVVTKDYENSRSLLELLPKIMPYIYQDLDS